jgi:hypothetical protein
MRSKYRETVAFAGTRNMEEEGFQLSPTLARELSRLGHIFSPIKSADVLININHNWKAIKRFNCSVSALPKYRVLIRLEPKCVYPYQYEKQLESQYDFIFTPGSIDQEKSNFIRWPYAYDENPNQSTAIPRELKLIVDNNFSRGLYSKIEWEGRPIFCSLIAANKVSSDGSGNYEYRRRVVKSIVDNDFKTYGAFWNYNLFLRLKNVAALIKFNYQASRKFDLSPLSEGILTRYPKTNGTVRNKHSIVEQSKFSLIVENSNDYVSEKFFDALVGGSIPIYMGPNLIPLGIPQSIFFQAPENPTNLLRFLKELDPKEIEERILAIRNFVQSPGFFEWDVNKVYRLIASELGTKLGVKNG